MSGAPSFLPNVLRQPLRDVRERLHGAVHAHDARVVGEHLRRLELARVPAGRLVGRVLHQALQQAHVALHVRIAPADERARVVADLPEDRIDDLHVRAVTVDEDDLVEPVVNEAARDVVHQRLERRGAYGDRAAPFPRTGHVLRRVAGPDGRRVQHVVDGATREATWTAVTVSVQSGRCGPCCSVLAMGTSTRSHFSQIGLDVRIGQLGHVAGSQFNGNRHGHGYSSTSSK